MSENEAPRQLYVRREDRAVAWLLTIKYNAKCTACGRALVKGERALGAPPNSRGNPGGRWAFGCVDCAEAA
jgi:hypothetical protein